jgi:iron-sulfur cluster assembly accessory protein
MSDATMTDAAASQEEIVSATTTATTKIRELQIKEGLDDKGLRVRVVGGGCHGFSYALGFDERKDGDTVQSIDGVDFLVDKFSAPYLMGANIDFVDGLNGAGFKIGNPNAKSTCGCGESFGA